MIRRQLHSRAHIIDVGSKKLCIRKMVEGNKC